MLASNTLSIHASDYPVKSVTIFQSSSAEVTRTFSVNLHVRPVSTSSDACITQFNATRLVVT